MKTLIRQQKITSTHSSPIILTKVRLTKLIIAMLATLLVACSGDSGNSPAARDTPAFSTREALGESLFFDANLSQDRTQSCASCHNPDHAFIDDRLDDHGQIAAVSVGDDGISLGDRNAPTAAYAALAPEFHEGTRTRINSDQLPYRGFLGGQFYDGREPDLEGQAAAPPLNPLEMNMPDKASVVERLLENDDYVESFKALFGAKIFDDVEAAYAAMTESIAEFERTEQFAPFDSKYDRFLRREYSYDPLSLATLGKARFFSKEFTNCATCHLLNAQGSRSEPFSSYEYHNIGVPENEAVRTINGSATDFIDTGLLNHPDVTDAAHSGKFKVPSLRNVAVTAPYMHNGVFRELRSVVLFYDKFINSANTINPETGEAWRAAEVADTISETELKDGQSMDATDVDALVCFLMTLTDARYEHLLDPDDVEYCGI